MKHLPLRLLSFGFLFLLLVIPACNKIKKDKGIIVSEPDYPACFLPPESGQQEWVIRNQAEYNALIALTACDPATVQAIDFNTYTLLGKYASGKCKGEFYRQVLREDDHR